MPYAWMAAGGKLHRRDFRRRFVGSSLRISSRAQATGNRRSRSGSLLVAWRLRAEQINIVASSAVWIDLPDWRSLEAFHRLGLGYSLSQVISHEGRHIGVSSDICKTLRRTFAPFPWQTRLVRKREAAARRLRTATGMPKRRFWPIRHKRSFQMKRGSMHMMSTRLLRGAGAAVLFASLVCAQAGPDGHWEGSLTVNNREVGVSLDLAGVYCRLQRS